ncbi:MAG: FtsW/RodA/SpoVE family cell cycle protein, partial [Lachnospiraceae bacterium]|nr:FtsW/RodA/SpoVE family cell cycle protein [Lachnospiraceae bacterium]
MIHALAYLCICVNIIQNPDIGLTIPKVLGFYAGQLVYLVIMSILIPSFISLSKGINNVLCMFLAIGFIFQTRLDFDTSVRQFFIVLFGTAAFLVFVFFCKRAKFLRNLTWIYCIVGMALLLLVLILSRVTKGAKLAIDLGFFSFQPMEFVKILFVMFVASAFHKANNLKTVIITAAAAAIHVLIVVFCRDLGSGLILSIIYVLMLYVATRKVRYLFIGAGGFAAAAFAAYHLFSHVRVRVQVWLDPWADIDNKGYQIAQSLFAVGTGGWLGSGIFRGSPNHIPVVSNDMVFSAIAEEMGAIFAILLILLCLCFVLMMMRVAIRVNNSFYKLLAFGLGTA